MNASRTPRASSPACGHAADPRRHRRHHRRPRRRPSPVSASSTSTRPPHAQADRRAISSSLATMFWPGVVKAVGLRRHHHADGLLITAASRQAPPGGAGPAREPCAAVLGAADPDPRPATTSLTAIFVAASAEWGRAWLETRSPNPRPQEALRLQGVRDRSRSCAASTSTVAQGAVRPVRHRRLRHRQVRHHQVRTRPAETRRGWNQLHGEAVSNHKTLYTIRRRTGMLFRAARCSTASPSGRTSPSALLHRDHVGRAEAKKRAIENPPGASSAARSPNGGAFRRTRTCCPCRRPAIANPDLIFFDEPTTGLDPIIADAVSTIVEQVKALGCRPPSRSPTHGLRPE